jgi:hypothetical protein
MLQLLSVVIIMTDCIVCLWAERIESAS